MNCPKEQEIERLVLGAAEMREETKLHLFRCDRCREQFLAFSAVYSPVLLGEKFISGGTTEAPTFTGLVITLFPLPWEQRGNPVFRLAAQGGQSDNFVTVLSFSDSEHGFIGRLLRDPHSGQVDFYLLADEMQQVQGIQIDVPDAGLHGITDLFGRVDFGVRDLPSCSRVEVVTPQVSFTLQPLDPAAEKNVERHTFTLRHLEEEEIEIFITREEAQGRYVFSFRRIDGRPSLRELKVVAVTDSRLLETNTERGVAVLQTETPERLLKIHIY